MDMDESQVHYEHLFSDTGAAPRLKDCLASFSCKINKQYDGGDHWIVVGEVLDLYKQDKQAEPLLFLVANTIILPRQKLNWLSQQAIRINKVIGLSYSANDELRTSVASYVEHHHVYIE